MTRSSRRVATAVAENNDDDAGEHSGSRRSTRSRNKTVFFTEKDEINNHVNNSDDYEDSNASPSEEEEAASAPVRKSSRSTAFRGEMKDPSNSISDLLKAVDNAYTTTAAGKRGRGSSQRSSLESSGKEYDDSGVDEESDAPKSKARRAPARSSRKGATSPVKSPAKRHTKQRKSKRLEYPASEEESSEDEGNDDDDSESDGEEDDDNDDMKIHRIIAARSLTLQEWKDDCKKMNTTEITNGSRWVQEEVEIAPRDLAKYEERYLVKWANLSFLHCSWETESDLVELIENAKMHLNTFFRKSVNGLLYDSDERLDGDYFDPSWLEIERILEVADMEEEGKKKNGKDGSSPVEKYNIILDVNHPDFESGTGRQFYVKWTNTPYSISTYEFERDLILNDIEYTDQLESYERRSKKPSRDDMRRQFKKQDDEKKKLYKIFGEGFKMTDEEREEKVKNYQDKLGSQIFKNGGQLRDYQAEGVSWLMSNHVNRRSSILADEMGLGKTIQTATYVNAVATQLATRGPFLIVAPLSTIPHWYREFSGWTDLNTIVYHGSANDRERAREDEFAFEKDRDKIGKVGFNEKYLNKVRKQWKGGKWEKTWMVQVVITTPEMLVTDDFAELAAVEWEILVVDEAHRLKNHASKLANNLRDSRFVFNHSLLLTGTPIQNNMQELWTLLHFIDPDSFDNLDSFMEKYGDIKSKERVDELHETIRPYMLRRLKEDVEKSVPPKEETLIEVELTVLQKQYYRALYEKNVKFLHRNVKKALDGPSINNLAMQLRKCCNHPFLLTGVESDVKNQQPGVDIVDLLVASSGKLVLLDKLLPRLKADGHRILLFSQFKIMLDIIEDYLNLRKFKCERIDGSITGLKRQAAIDRFQTKESGDRESPFIMLLSTRAGGVGINLTAADTCIIFDSDWNPQNDLQAQARCHRIGQTKSVKIYRLLTRKTYEMQMFHMSSLKMGLDQAVLQGIENTGGNKDLLNKEEVERLLKHGAYDIFKEDKDGTSEKESSDFVSQDIDSILERRTKTVIHENTGSKSNAAGGTFSKASFKNTNSDGIDAADVDIDDPLFWQKVVGEKQEEEKVNLVDRKRTRAKTNYSERDYLKMLDAQIKHGGGASDDDSKAASDSSEYNGAGDGESSDDESLVNGALDNVALKSIIKATKPKKHKERYMWGGSASTEWTQSDAEQVLKSLQSFGYSNISWDSFSSSLTLSRPYTRDEIKRMCWAMALLCLYEAAEDDVLEENRKAKVRANESNKDGDALSRTDTTSAKSNNADESSGKIEKSQDQLQVSFKKLLSANESWASKALADSLKFSETSPSRDKKFVEDVLSGVHSSRNPVKTNTVQLMLSEMFHDSVWPALRSRGWKKDETNGSTHQFTYQGKSFKSITAVLNIMPKQHPELMNMVHSLIASVSATCEKNEDQAGPALDPNNVTAASMKSFLNDYAPLQLLADRNRAHRISLTKRFISQLAFLHGVHSMISLADSKVSPDASLDDRNKQLSALIKVHSKTIRPHDEWTSLHDAILIRAIAKHGWLDRRASCVAIVEDKTIHWGSPFEASDETGSSTKKNDPNSDSEENSNASKEQLLNVASRAANALNKHSDILDEFRGIQQFNLIKSFALVRSTAVGHVDPCDDDDGAGAEEAVIQWNVDENNLTSKKVGPEELPPRKDLLRRAKRIVMSFTDGTVGNDEEKDDAPEDKLGAASLNNGPTDHGFSVLDQDCRENAFLAEMLRGLLKSTTKHTVRALQRLAALILIEIDARMEDIAKSGDDAKLKEMAKMRKDVELYTDYFKTNSRSAKNILRVILGIDPVPSKDPSASLFPTKCVKNPPSAVAKAALSKVKRKAFTPADAALNRALASLKDIANNKDANTSEHLRFTSTEILMLTVMSSQGLPVFCDDWNSLILAETSCAGDIDSDNFQIYFFAMGGVMEAAAGVWLGIAKTKLQEKLKLLDDNNQSASDTARQKLFDEIAILQKDHDAKKMTLEDSKHFNKNPLIFARKSLMLLEAIRKHMGPIDLQYAGEKKIRALNKSENGLGTKVLNWFSKEIKRWSAPLQIVDGAGNVLSATSIGLAREHPQSHDAALMTKRDCRTVFNQVAQQTRLRSIFIKHETDRLASELIPKAFKQSTFSNSDWEERPSWWNSVDNKSTLSDCQDDLDLLVGILDYGYGGFDCMLKHDFPFCIRLKAEEKEDSRPLTRASVQARVNHLTRELHAIDDSEVMMKLIKNRTARSKADSSNSSSTGKKTSKPGGGIQPGLDAFFKRPAGTTAPTSNKKQKTPPTSPEQSDVEVITIDIDSGSDNENATNKRKDIDANDSSRSKKQK